MGWSMTVVNRVRTKRVTLADQVSLARKPAAMRPDCSYRPPGPFILMYPCARGDPGKLRSREEAMHQRREDGVGLGAPLKACRCSS